MSGGRFSDPMAYGMVAELGSFDRLYDPKAEELDPKSGTHTTTCGRL